MFGVLVDVTGSMESAYALDRLNDANVERSLRLLTSSSRKSFTMNGEGLFSFVPSDRADLL